MRKRILIAAALVVAVGLIMYAILTVTSSSIRLGFDFRDGLQGWEAGFAVYGPQVEDMMLVPGGTRSLASFARTN